MSSMINKKIISGVLLLILTAGLLMLAGCSEKKSSASTDSAKKGGSIDIYITIEYPKKSKLAGLENIKFPVEEESTALQTIELFCSISDIPCLLETTSNTIVGINTVVNGDFNKNKVWKFSVNDSTPRTDAADVRLKDGDVLKWIYELSEEAAAEKESETEQEQE